MTPDQVHLLKSLGSGVRPVDLGEDTPIDTDRFEGLLHDAIRGRARTELGVTFAPDASGMFDQHEQGQIARAIDLAAAAGSEQALILHNEHSLRVDVRNRVVLEAPKLNPNEVVRGIDAFIPLQTPADSEDAAVVLRTSKDGFQPARVVRNASLVHTLAQSQPTHDL